MIEELRALTDSDLREVAQALGVGRLFAPFTPTALRRYCGADAATPLAETLQRHAEEGMRPDQLALLFEAHLAGRSSLSDREPVELVWSGPELPGMANRDTGVVVRELFTRARREVIVAGYAVYQGHEVFRALATRMDQQADLRVRLYLDVRRPHGDTSSEAEILRWFARRFRDQEWPGQRLPEVWYDPRSLATDQAKRSSLHAKCVVIDRSMALVSSANFTEAALLRNLEVGVIVHDDRFAAHLAGHFEALADARLLLPMVVERQEQRRLS